MFKTKLLHQFFPEMVVLHGEWRKASATKTTFTTRLRCLTTWLNTALLWLRWAAIMHVAKPPTKRRRQGGWTFHGHEDRGANGAQNFRPPKAAHGRQDEVCPKLVLLHLRPIALTKDVVTDSAIRRLLFEAGDDIDLMVLCRADIVKNEAKVERHFRNYDVVVKSSKTSRKKTRSAIFSPQFRGNHDHVWHPLHPRRGIKNAIKEAILDGDIKNDLEATADACRSRNGPHPFLPTVLERHRPLNTGRSGRCSASAVK